MLLQISFLVLVGLAIALTLGQMPFGIYVGVVGAIAAANGYEAWGNIGMFLGVISAIGQVRKDIALLSKNQQSIADGLNKLAKRG
jgi:hypothetical protein